MQHGVHSDSFFNEFAGNSALECADFRYGSSYNDVEYDHELPECGNKYSIATVSAQIHFEFELHSELPVTIMTALFWHRLYR